ncbi:MAG: YceI family protein [Prolixibacteraceae bacterium]|jgi:polyisoprenoid-binding protein YceI|nr:YceI family protein [Prolixibacteraceae bacterium]
MKKIVTLNIIVLFFAFTLNAQSFVAKPDKSELIWTGKKIAGKHYGNIDLTEGSFVLDNNKISEGLFVIDITSISNEDLEGDMNDKLVGHLKSDDFFSVDKHPTAVLKINSSTQLINGKATVKGELTIKGTTHPIEFEGNKIGNVFKATVTVDRTKYGIRYGSGKFFENLGDNMIDDNFILEVTLVTEQE